MSYTGRQIYTIPADSAALDAFGRQRVSNNHVLLASAQLDNAQPAIWDTDTDTGGTIAAHDADRSSTLLSTDTTNNARAVRQTRVYYAYKPGQSQLVAATFVAETGNTANIVRRSYVSGSAVDTKIAAASWNVDSFDGTGPSGITLDTSKAQILLIDLQWLGVGRVRVGFDIDGQFYPAHEFLHANSVTSVYMTTARLPVRYEVVNDASNTFIRVGYFDDENGIFFEVQKNGVVAAQLESICAGVVREGGDEEQAMPNAAATPIGSKVTLTASNDYSVLAIRLASTHPRALLRDLAVRLVKEDAETARWQVTLLRSADLPAGFTGWTNAGSTAFPSPVEYSTSRVDMATALSSGREILGGILPSGAGSAESTAGADASPPYLLSSDIAGNSDVLVLSGRTVSTSIDVWGHLHWHENL